MQPPPKVKEILEELSSVGSGKTFDALLPPLVFVLVNSLWGLEAAAAAAPGLALILGLFRLARGQTWFYALGGLLGAGLAAGMAYLTRSAAGFFIPALAGSALLVLLALASLAFDRPLAAWASHLTRGWPLDWFWREDVKPAYRAVTRFWAFFFSMRLAAQVYLFLSGDAVRLAWANALLGWPLIAAVLIATYIYGIRRLQGLGGPGVEEYRAGKAPPWQGQTRGF